MGGQSPDSEMWYLIGEREGVRKVILSSKSRAFLADLADTLERKGSAVKCEIIPKLNWRDVATMVKNKRKTWVEP